MLIRDATADDAVACAAIYAPYVCDTAVSFELEPPSVEEMAGRIARAQANHAWLVLDDGGVAGYAYAGAFAPRPAYRWSCEVSVYLEMGRRRSGAGRALYTELLPGLVARGLRTAFAGMTLPNPASEGFHRALGFTTAGTYEHVGWKLGAWRDVLWLQRRLTDDDSDPT